MQVKIMTDDGVRIYSDATHAIAIKLSPVDIAQIATFPETGYAVHCAAPPNHPILRDPVKQHLFGADGWDDPPAKAKLILPGQRSRGW